MSIPIQPKKKLEISEVVKIIKSIVAKYMYAGHIHKSNKEDTEMNIVTKYLAIEKKIWSNFNGRSKPETYCYTIINRLCSKEIDRTKHDLEYNDNYQDKAELNYNDTIKRLIIKDELLYFNKVLITFGTEYKKIKLLAKILYKLPVTEEDTSQYNDEKARQINDIIEGYRDKSKGEIYPLLAAIVSITEERDCSSDAIRVWLNGRLTEIVKRMNGSTLRTYYSKSTIEYLFEYFEMYFDKKILISFALILILNSIL